MSKTIYKAMDLVDELTDDELKVMQVCIDNKLKERERKRVSDVASNVSADAKTTRQIKRIMELDDDDPRGR